MQNLETDQSWDEEVSALGGGVLQSAAWAKFQEAVGRPAARNSEEGWTWQAFERRSRGIKYLFSPYGPVVRQNAPEALESILVAARERGMDFVRLEPVGAVTAEVIKSHGGRQISDIEPACTAVLNLAKSEEELKSGLSSSHRNRINTAPKRGLEVKSTTDLQTTELFLKLMNDTAKHARITNHSDGYYRQMAEILIPSGLAKYYVAYGEGQPVSCSLIFDWQGTRYYAFTGNDQSLNRKYNASVYSVWRMIIEAREAGLTKFDFWGIAPTDDSSHAWAGITAFKLAFGGERVATIGTWDIPVKQAKYSAYSAYRKISGKD